MIIIPILLIVLAGLVLAVGIKAYINIRDGGFVVLGILLCLIFIMFAWSVSCIDDKEVSGKWLKPKAVTIFQNNLVVVELPDTIISKYIENGQYLPKDKVQVYQCKWVQIGYDTSTYYNILVRK